MATNEFDDDDDLLLDDEAIEDDPEDETLEADEPEDDEPEAKRDKRPMKEWLKEDLAAERKRRQQAEARLAELERQAAEREAAAAESEIAAAKAEWQEAYRADDAEGLESANAKLVAAQVKAATRQAPAEKAESEAPPAAIAWVERNPWFRNDQAKTDRAMEINNALIAEGLDPSHPRFYSEIDKRLRATPRMNGPKTIGGVVRDSPRSSQPDQPLKASDKANMKRFGVDPSDPAARRMWLRSNKRLNEAAR
jgi:hypothetical protein